MSSTESAPASASSTATTQGPVSETRLVDGASALADVKQFGLFAAIASLGYVFWVVGGMEMVERLAYYGVKAVATLYAKAPASAGGLGVEMSRFGTILSFWALTQTVVPVFTGGLSDRYGYKETIFASTIIKISGYLTMAFFPTFRGFFVGAILLATGTAIFKPGIQGTLARVTNRQNSSVGWGLFYQTVNIGGSLAPLVAGFMRKLAWRNVFLTCAAIICCNFLLLLTYKEPGKAERLERTRLMREGKLERKSLARESLREIRKRHVWTYLLVFSGFWFMFNALFDVLPAHIEDWVDTRHLVLSLFGGHPPSSPLVRFFVVMNAQGTEIQPEGMLNLDAVAIMFTCFVFAWLSGKMRATVSMVFGTLVATASLLVFGVSVTGGLAAIAILVFAVGEMFSSPKFSEFIANFAPDDKKAMYLGFSQVPIAIGWTLEGKLGLWLYDHFASKERFAREMLAARGMRSSMIARIPEGEAFQRLVDFTHQDRWALTSQLYASHHVGWVWFIMAIVGVVSALGIAVYGRWVQTLVRKPG